MSTNVDTSGNKAAGKGDKTEKVSLKVPESESTNNNISKPHHHGNQQGNHRRAFKKPVTRQPRFQGKCDDLKGYIYDCSDWRQADVYTKTTKEIGEYIGRTYCHGSDVRRAVQTLVMPVMIVPADPPEGAPRSIERMWEKKIDEFVKREPALEENLRTFYTLVWGQCSEVVRAQSEVLDSYGAMSEDFNSMALLKAIKGIAYNFQRQKYKPNAFNESKSRLYLLIQDKFTTCQQGYLDRFQNCVDVIQHCGGSIGDEPTIVNETLVADGVPDAACNPRTNC
jgi:hypothetical protein